MTPHKLKSIAAAAARKVAQRFPQVDLAELLSAALYAGARAQATWRPERGSPLPAYVHIAAYRAAWRKASRAAQRTIPTMPTVVVPMLACSKPNPEAQAEQRRWLEAARQRLAALITREPELLARALVRVLLHGEPLREVAQTEGLDPSMLANAKTRARHAIKNDARARELWRQACQPL